MQAQMTTQRRPGPALLARCLEAARAYGCEAGVEGVTDASLLTRSDEMCVCFNVQSRDALAQDEIDTAYIVRIDTRNGSIRGVSHFSSRRRLS